MTGAAHTGPGDWTGPGDRTDPADALQVGIVWNPAKADHAELTTAWEAALSSTRSSTTPHTGRTADETLASTPEVHWFETSPDDPGRAATSAALAAGCTLVIAAGGDGTVRAVAEQLGASGSPAADLGIVPLGTGNLLARNLGVPLGDAEAAFHRALTADGSPLDLGRVEVTFADDSIDTHGFVVMMGFGIDAQMIVETDDDLKARAGWLAYVESLGRAARGTEVVDFTLTLDSEAPRTESAHTVLIANCGTLQGGVTLLPDAEPDDGQLDLLVLRADGVAAWLDTLRTLVWENGVKRVLTGADTVERTPSTDMIRARTAKIALERPITMEIDGDELTGAVGLNVEVLPAALRVR